MSPQNQPFPTPQRGRAEAEATVPEEIPLGASLGAEVLTLPQRQIIFDSSTSGGSGVVQWALPPIGGILEYHWQEWQALGAKPWVVSILRRGYKLVFIEKPKLSPLPIFVQPPKLPQRVILLEMEINKLIEKRAVEFVPPGTPGYYSHMFLVSKGENKWRPIIDLSVLNTMLWIPSFHMETPESIRTAIQLNDWTVSIDLSDAFLHIQYKSRLSS